MSSRLLFYGDPHGVLGPLISAGCQLGPGDAVVCVGDWDAESPLPVLLRPLTERGIRMAWVPGNHDTDTTDHFDNTFTASPGGNIHGRCLDVAGVRVGGLGGIFGASIWYPREDMAEPMHASAEAYLRTLRHQQRWRKGLPLAKRAIIFPDTFDQVADLHLDVLVTHEAPLSGHEHGFFALDELARRTGARLLVHGHHHRSYCRAVGGLTVRGLAKAEVWEADVPALIGGRRTPK